MISSKREKGLLAVIVILAIVVCGLIYTKNPKGNVVLELNQPEKNEEEVGISDKQEAEEIAVYIAGEVNQPGVYQVLTTTRIQDVITLAGGTKAEADLMQVNLAKKVQDEEMILIPKFGESMVEQSSIVGTTVANGNGKVNINIATKEELDTLPGIGPAYADRIIEYRETSGKFEDIEAIKNVSGIGDKTFEKLKDLIVVK